MHSAPASGMATVASDTGAFTLPSDRAIIREAMVATLEDMITTLEDTLSVLPSSKCAVPPPPPYPPPIVNRRGTYVAPAIASASIDGKGSATTRASSPCLSHACPTPNVAWSGPIAMLPIASIPTPTRSRTMTVVAPQCPHRNQTPAPQLASVVRVEASEAARQEQVFRKSRSTPSLGGASAAVHVRYASPQDCGVNAHRSVWTRSTRSPPRFGRNALSPGPSRRGGSTKRHITVQIVADAVPPKRSNSFVRISSTRQLKEDHISMRQSFPASIHMQQAPQVIPAHGKSYQCGAQLPGSVAVPHTSSTVRIAKLASAATALGSATSATALGSATSSARSWAPSSRSKASARSRQTSPHVATPSWPPPPGRRPPQPESARAYAYRQPVSSDVDVQQSLNPSPTDSQYPDCGDAGNSGMVSGSFQSDGDAGAGIGNVSSLDDNIEQPQMLLRAIRWVFAAFGLPPPPLDPPTLRVLVRDFEMQQLEMGANWQTNPTCCAQCARHVCAMLFELASGERALVPVACGKSVPVSTMVLEDEHIHEDWFLAYASSVEDIRGLLLAWDDEEHQQRIQWIFRTFVRAGADRLQWGVGDVVKFAHHVFALLKLPPLQCPAAVIYQLARDCESGMGADLDETKAVHFARHLLDTILELQSQSSPSSEGETDVSLKDAEIKDALAAQRDKDNQTMGYARSLFEFMVSLHPTVTSDSLDQSSVTLPPPSGNGMRVASPDVAGGHGISSRMDNLTTVVTSEALEKACCPVSQPTSQTNPNADFSDILQWNDGINQRANGSSAKATSSENSPKSSRLLSCTALKRDESAMLQAQIGHCCEADLLTEQVELAYEKKDEIAPSDHKQFDFNVSAIDADTHVVEIVTESDIQMPSDLSHAIDGPSDVFHRLEVQQDVGANSGGFATTELEARALLQGAALRCGITPFSAASDEESRRGNTKTPCEASPLPDEKPTAEGKPTTEIEGVRRSLTPPASAQAPEVAPKAAYQVMSSELFRALARRRSKNGETWSPLSQTRETCTIEVPRIDVPTVPSPCRNRGSIQPLDSNVISASLSTPKGAQAVLQAAAASLTTPENRTQQYCSPQMLTEEEQASQDINEEPLHCTTQFFDIGTPAEGTSPPTQSSHELEEVWNSEGVSRLAAA